MSENIHIDICTYPDLWELSLPAVQAPPSGTMSPSTASRKGVTRALQADPWAKGSCMSDGTNSTTAAVATTTLY